MPLSPTNIQTTTFSNQVVQAYTQGAYFRDDMAMTVKQPQGGKTKRFPVFGNITVATQADGTDLSAGASYTPTAVDISTFDPTLAYETVLYQTISDFEGYIPAALSKRLGMDLALRRSNILTNIVAKTAYDRGSNAGKIELTGTAGAIPADSAFSDGFQSGLLKLRNAQVNPANCVAILRPEFFYALRRQQIYAGYEYIKSGMTDNATMNGTMFYGGIEIIPAAGTLLGTNTAANTALPSTSRANATDWWGCIFAKDALGVYETESEHGAIEDIPHRQSWLTTGRTIFGAAALQPTAMFVFINEA